MKVTTHLFCMTFQVMMMPHHTKYGYERLSDSEDNLWTKHRHMDRQTDKQAGTVTPEHHH